MLRLSRRNLALYAAEKLVQGDKEVISQLAAYLVGARRVKEADLLVHDIERALESRGTVVARLKTAHELDAVERADVETILKRRYKAETVALSTAVDERLLGGVVITTASDEYDGSIQRSINRLKALNV